MHNYNGIVTVNTSKTSDSVDVSKFLRLLLRPIESEEVEGFPGDLAAPKSSRMGDFTALTLMLPGNKENKQRKTDKQRKKNNACYQYNHDEVQATQNKYSGLFFF